MFAVAACPTLEAVNHLSDVATRMNADPFNHREGPGDLSDAMDRLYLLADEDGSVSREGAIAALEQVLTEVQDFEGALIRLALRHLKG